MSKIYRATASLVAVAAFGVLSGGVAATIGAGVANAEGMTYDQCMSEAARRDAEFESHQDPNSTHASFVKFKCVEAGSDINGNKLYEVTYEYVSI